MQESKRLFDTGLFAGENKVHIYTDGSCPRNPGHGGWAYILYNGNPRSLDQNDGMGSGGERDTTNNRMELLAAIKGLEAIQAPSVVEVFTDSKYLQRAFTDNWLRNWKQNGWMGTMGPVKNKDLWLRLDELVRFHINVTWTHVYGHRCNQWNNECDRLAGLAARRIMRGS